MSRRRLLGLKPVIRELGGWSLLPASVTDPLHVPGHIAASSLVPYKDRRS